MLSFYVSGSPGFVFLNPLSLATDDCRSVLAVKGSLRRFAPWTAAGRSSHNALPVRIHHFVLAALARYLLELVAYGLSDDGSRSASVASLANRLTASRTTSLLAK